MFTPDARRSRNRPRSVGKFGDSESRAGCPQRKSLHIPAERAAGETGLFVHSPS